MSGPDRLGERQAGLRETSDASFTVPVIEAHAVVQTRLVLVEEIRIRRTAHAHAECHKVPLRREVVEITRPPIPQQSREGPPMAMSEQTTSAMPATGGAMPENFLA